MSAPNSSGTGHVVMAVDAIEQVAEATVWLDNASSTLAAGLLGIGGLTLSEAAEQSVRLQERARKCLELAMFPVMAPIDMVLDKLVGAKRNGSGFVAWCPAHEDGNPSLSVSAGDDGRVLLNCFAGCELDRILDALALKPADLFASNGAKTAVAEYEYVYTDEQGEPLYAAHRHEFSDGSKKMWQQRRDGKGHMHKLGDVRRVIYNLPRVIQGISDGKTIFVVEGEKCAEVLRTNFSVIATTNVMGAGKWRKDYNPIFTNAKVVVLPDNDEPGRKHALNIASNLKPLAASLKVVELAGLPDKGDIVDWARAGARRDDLRDLVEAAPEWEPETEEPEPEIVLLPDEDGAQLLDEVVEFVRRYVVCTSAASVVTALWVTHTHGFDAFDVSPRYFASSSEPGSAKTRMLELLKVLVRAPLFMANVSEAYLFRRVDAEPCTVLHDEIDTVFGNKARDREELRAMFNAGWERGAVVGRMVGEGSKMRPHDFNVFAPVAMAGVGRLPETIEQRSFVVRLKKKKRDEPAARFRKREVGPEAAGLRDRLASWCARRLAEFEQARPELPEELSDRAPGAAEPLLAIVDAAGGDWPQRARDAVVELMQSRDQSEATIGVRLLADVRAVFDDADLVKVHDTEKGDGLPSGDVAAALAKIEGAPWAEWGKKQAPITANALARILMDKDVSPKQHWMADVGANMRGYLRADFEDSWARYLPPLQSVSDVQLLEPSASAGATSNTLSPLTVATGGSGNVDEWERATLAALDPDAEDWGHAYANIRAEAVRRRRMTP